VPQMLAELEAQSKVLDKLLVDGNTKAGGKTQKFSTAAVVRVLSGGGLLFSQEQESSTDDDSDDEEERLLAALQQTYAGLNEDLVQLDVHGQQQPASHLAAGAHPPPRHDGGGLHRIGKRQGAEAQIATAEGATTTTNREEGGSDDLGGATQGLLGAGWELPGWGGSCAVS
jgi:hypothetical protein